MEHAVKIKVYECTIMMPTNSTSGYFPFSPGNKISDAAVNMIKREREREGEGKHRSIPWRNACLYQQSPVTAEPK